MLDESPDQPSEQARTVVSRKATDTFLDPFTRKVLLIVAVLFVVGGGAAAVGILWGPRIDYHTAWEAFDARFPAPTGRQQIEDIGFSGTRRITRTLWQWDGRRVRTYYELTAQAEFRSSPNCIQSYGALVDARTGELLRTWRDLSPRLSIGCTEAIPPLWG